MWLDQELPINPAIERERVAQPPHDENAAHFDDHITSHTVTVGEVCFVAIGQIVGRAYTCVRYQPSACVVINSTSAKDELRRAVRAIWKSGDPQQHLLDSLLRDFSTDGVFNGDSLDGWDVGSELRCSAAMRMLYYFPNQTAELVVDQLKRLDVRGEARTSVDQFIKREVANRVRAQEFIKATAWCDRPEIREQIIRLFKESNETSVVLACLPGVTDTKLVQARLSEVIDALPPNDGGPYGEAHDLLVALGGRRELDCKPIFMKYMKGGSFERCRTMCQVLRSVRGDWSAELLAPLLDDQRGFDTWTYALVKGQNEPRRKMRLGYEAAATISASDKSLHFILEGEPDSLDGQIQEMKAQIAKRPT
jgi:hypothetical protein